MIAPPTTAATEDISKEQYERFRKLIYAESGINLGAEKAQLVRARLGKRLRQLNLSSYGEYYELVRSDKTGAELCNLLDAISTNTTHLFREKRHFDLLHELISRWWKSGMKRRSTDNFRIWSAGCSSGEEPHSIAMTIADALEGNRRADVRILATDISTRMLKTAREAAYETHRLGTVPPAYCSNYFEKIHDGQGAKARLIQPLRDLITFGRFNLMAPTFPFKHGFDVIFCRNVMIYFDRPTQQGLVNRFAMHLRPGGHLFIGHSESLNGIEHPLAYVEPTVYRKS
ncbi:MAG: protein-glutamate O-methyltransferase [Phycisphaerae bacterium]|nr:protein-glutamate O-methyltransferase [Phycisphaerae bacterium]